MKQVVGEGNQKLGKIKTTTIVTDQAYEIIKEAILKLKLRPWERLRELTLAKELGISTTPVRSALERLVQDGLVVTVPFKGAYVADIDERDVEEIFELRMLLEISAIRKAASNINSSDIAKGKILVQAMKEAHRDGDVESFAGPSRDFHRLFISKFGNQRMILLLQSYDEQLERVRRIVIRTKENIPLFIQDYESILDAVSKRDPEKAAQELLMHLKRSMEIFRVSKTAKESGH